MEASDISQVGCCLDFVSAPREGDLVWVQLTGLQPLASEVRWLEGCRVGVSFAHPIQAIIFQVLIDQFKETGALSAS